MMMPASVDSGMTVVSLLGCFRPPVQMIGREWTCQSMKQFKGRLMDILVTSEVGYGEALFSRIEYFRSSRCRYIHVKDATVPPPLRAQSNTVKKRRIKRSSAKQKGDEPSEWFNEGGIGINGRWGGGNNGKGWDYRAENWNEGWQWSKVLYFLYDIACFISFYQCVHYALFRVVIS